MVRAVPRHPQRAPLLSASRTQPPLPALHIPLLPRQQLASPLRRPPRTPVATTKITVGSPRLKSHALRPAAALQAARRVRRPALTSALLCPSVQEQRQSGQSQSRPRWRHAAPILAKPGFLTRKRSARCQTQFCMTKQCHSATGAAHLEAQKLRRQAENMNHCKLKERIKWHETKTKAKRKKKKTGQTRG